LVVSVDVSADVAVDANVIVAALGNGNAHVGVIGDVAEAGSAAWV
jgi:hypothetical protein